MSSAFGNDQQERAIRNFSQLRLVAWWAALLGMIQAAIWIILSALGIFHHNCLFAIDTTVTYGSIVKFVFFELYFHGNCKPDIYASINYDILNTVETILSPQAILIWTSIYLAIMVAWLIFSAMLIKCLDKDDIYAITSALYVWIGITLLICIQDLILGIFFAIDYGRFYTRANDYNLATYEAGERDPDAVQLIGGEISAIFMMFVSMKGFVLWVSNCTLMVYLLMQVLNITGVISDDDSIVPVVNDFGKIEDKPPIQAYSEQPNRKLAVYSNNGFIPENQSTPASGAIEINQDPLARAARIAMDTCLQDRRFRNIENYQQYPPVAGLPAPDYTPPMKRATSPQRSSRF